jgi:hypothetical protein
MKAYQIVATGGSCIALFGTMYWCFRGVTAFLNLLGPLKVMPHFHSIPIKTLAARKDVFILEVPDQWTSALCLAALYHFR